MFRLKRETRQHDSQVFRLGTSVLYQYFVMRAERIGYDPYAGSSGSYRSYWDGRKWYSYQATTYNTYESVGPYHINFALGRWYQLGNIENVATLLTFL